MVITPPPLPQASEAAHPPVPPEVLIDVAAYFDVLSEPTRLQLLNALRRASYSVGELAQECGLSAATVSRHLSLMAQHGFVERHTRGNSVHYAVADPSIDALCDLVCRRIAQRWDLEQQRRTGGFSSLQRKDDTPAASPEAA